MSNLNYQINGTDLNEIIATTDNTNWTLPNIRPITNYKLNNVDISRKIIFKEYKIPNDPNSRTDSDIVQSSQAILNGKEENLQQYTVDGTNIIGYKREAIPQFHYIETDSTDTDKVVIDGDDYKIEDPTKTTKFYTTLSKDNYHYGLFVVDINSDIDDAHKTYNSTVTLIPKEINDTKYLLVSVNYMGTAGIAATRFAFTDKPNTSRYVTYNNLQYDIQKVKILRDVLTFIACGAGGSGANASGNFGAGGGGGGGYGIGVIPLEKDTTYKFTLGKYGRVPDSNSDDGNDGGDTIFYIGDEEAVRFGGGKGGSFGRGSTGAGGVVTQLAPFSTHNGILDNANGGRGGSGTKDAGQKQNEAGYSTSQVGLEIIKNIDELIRTSGNTGGPADITKKDSGGGGGASLGFGGAGGIGEKGGSTGGAGTLGGGGGGGAGHLNQKDGGTGGRGTVILFFD